MKPFNFMFLIGVLILVVGIGLVSYVKDDSFSVRGGAPWYEWHWYEIKTKPYFVQGIGVIAVGVCLLIVWLFWYATQKSSNEQKKIIEETMSTDWS